MVLAFLGCMGFALALRNEMNLPFFSVLKHYYEYVLMVLTRFEWMLIECLDPFMYLRSVFYVCWGVRVCVGSHVLFCEWRARVSVYEVVDASKAYEL